LDDGQQTFVGRPCQLTDPFFPERVRKRVVSVGACARRRPATTSSRLPVAKPERPSRLWTSNICLPTGQPAPKLPLPTVNYYRSSIRGHSPHWPWPLVRAQSTVICVGLHLCCHGPSCRVLDAASELQLRAPTDWSRPPSPPRPLPSTVPLLPARGMSRAPHQLTPQMQAGGEAAVYGIEDHSMGEAVMASGNLI